MIFLAEGSARSGPGRAAFRVGALVRSTGQGANFEDTIGPAGLGLGIEVDGREK